MQKSNNTRIDALLESLNISQMQLANKLNVTTGAITNWKKRELGVNVINKIVDAYPQVNRLWLMTGEGDIFNSNMNQDVDQKEITKRIEELIKLCQSPTTFAVEIGFNEDALNKKMNGQHLWTIKDINMISEKLRVRKGWLLDGEGQMMKAPDEALDQIPAMPTKQNNHDGIPLIPTSAMAGALSGDSITINEWDIETRIVVPVFKKSDFCIRVDGDSMTPRYLRGDILACTRVPLTDLWFQWGKVYCVDTRQGALVKHIEKGKDDDHILLVSDNSDYKPFEIATSELFGVAIVNGLIRVE